MNLLRKLSSSQKRHIMDKQTKLSDPAFFTIGCCQKSFRQGYADHGITP